MYTFAKSVVKYYLFLYAKGAKTEFVSKFLFYLLFVRNKLALHALP